MTRSIISLPPSLRVLADRAAAHSAEHMRPHYCEEDFRRRQQASLVRARPFLRPPGLDSIKSGISCSAQAKYFQ